MTKAFQTFTAALFLAGTFLSPTYAAARPMTAEDLATLKRMGSVAVSPDEKWAAFDVTETDPESYTRSTALYLLALDKPQAVPLSIARPLPPTAVSIISAMPAVRSSFGAATYPRPVPPTSRSAPAM